MPILIRIVLLTVCVFAAGSALGPLLGGIRETAQTTLSPFLLLSAALLVASVAYAIGTIRR